MKFHVGVAVYNSMVPLQDEEPSTLQLLLLLQLLWACHCVWPSVVFTGAMAITVSPQMFGKYIRLRYTIFRFSQKTCTVINMLHCDSTPILCGLDLNRDQIYCGSRPRASFRSQSSAPRAPFCRPLGSLAYKASEWNVVIQMRPRVHTLCLKITDESNSVLLTYRHTCTCTGVRWLNIQYIN